MAWEKEKASISGEKNKKKKKEKGEKVMETPHGCGPHHLNIGHEILNILPYELDMMSLIFLS